MMEPQERTAAYLVMVRMEDRIQKTREVMGLDTPHLESLRRDLQDLAGELFQLESAAAQRQEADNG